MTDLSSTWHAVILTMRSNRNGPASLCIPGRVSNFRQGMDAAPTTGTWVQLRLRFRLVAYLLYQRAREKGKKRNGIRRIETATLWPGFFLVSTWLPEGENELHRAKRGEGDAIKSKRSSEAAKSQQLRSVRALKTSYLHWLHTDKLIFTDVYCFYVICWYTHSSGLPPTF